MNTIFLIVAVAAFSVLLLRVFLNASPSALAAGLQRGAGAFLIASAIGLVVMRQFAWALPLAFLGVSILRRSGFFRMTSKSPGGSSTVRSAGLELMLDHDSGDLDGNVLAGRHEGQTLSDLSLPALLEVIADFDGDAESIRLLEGYLDRSHPGWRGDGEDSAGGRSGAASGSVSMSTQEAYEILGLAAGSSEIEVREAHRRLIKQVHPDRGGSAALAAKINEAKDKLLG